ncbi:hypothetical protein AB1F87_002270 [Vibrio mimicus]
MDPLSELTVFFNFQKRLIRAEIRGYCEKMKDAKLYTHKKNENDIFIKNISKISDNHFQCDLRLITNHNFYCDFLPCTNRINPIFLLECARQIETYLSHTEFGITLDSKFLLDSWSMKYYPTRTGDAERLKADIYSKYPTINKKNKNQFNVIFKINMTVICTVTIDVRYITGHCYKLIRSIPDGINTLGVIAPLSPASACYTSNGNVILADLNDNGPYVKAIININKNNKSLNDHEQDHITGMNLTEAAKQICYSYLLIYMNEKSDRFIPVNLKGSFFSFVEKHIPAFVVIKKVELQDNIYSFDVDVIQSKETLATVSLKLRGEHG